MKSPRSIRSAQRRLKVWRGIVAVALLISAFLLSKLIAQFVNFRLWLAVPLVAFFAATAFQLIRSKAPRKLKWIGHTREQSDRPPVAESFEVDDPCEKCGALNIGVEAAEFSNYADKVSVFRTCARCWHTQWWAGPKLPPRIRRRERVEDLSTHCAECGYALRGIDPIEVDRERSVLVFSRKCPECGKAEFYRRRDGTLTPPPPPQSASR